MSVHTKLWYLEHFRMLDVLTPAQMSVVEKMTQMIKVPRGQRIYHRGEPSNAVYLLKAGLVKISIGRDDGQDIILAFLHPGDLFGELAIVDEAPRDHVATAHEDTVLCSLNRDILLNMIQQSPALGYQITKIMGFRLRHFRTRVEELIYKSAHARVAYALLDLAGEHGIRDGDGILLPLRLSQGDLGKLVGLARETVNIVLQEFKQRGLVELDRRRIRITDPDHLRAVTS